MKIAAAFKQVVSEAKGGDPTQKEESTFAKLGKDREPAEPDEGEEGDEPTSMGQAFARYREKAREEQFAKPSKKKKKAPVVDESELDDSEIKLTVPKKSEKKKKAPKEETQEEESDDSEEEAPKKEASKDKKPVIPDEEEESDEQEEPKPKSQLTEAEEKALKRLLEIDPDSLVSATGQPISKKVSDNIRSLKQHLEYFANKARKLETSVPGFDPRLKTNYEQIKAAHDELKKKYADRFFEETPEWEETFVAPLKNASLEMAKWLKSHDHGEDEDVMGEMQVHRSKLEEALAKGDDVMYYEHVDALAEFLKKGASARFQAAAPALWDAFQKKEEAYKDKDTARKKIREGTTMVAEEETKKASTAIDTTLKEFEAKNAHVIEAYKNDPRFKDFIDYENTVEAPISSAKEHLALAVKRRQITPALTDLVVKGALFGLKQKEHEGFLERIRVLEEERDRLEKKLEQKEGTLNKVKPSRASVTDDDDDDEDDDQPSSFAEHFKRKRAAGLV